LKQLNGIARRILDEDLLTTVAGDDFSTEAPSRSLELLDGRFQVLGFDLDSVPTTWSRMLTPRHGLSRAAGTGPVEQQL